MNVFEYFIALIQVLFESAGDNQSIKGALLLLVLVGFFVGFFIGLIVSHFAHKKARI